MLENIVTDEFDNIRLDRVLANLYPDYSRSRLQQWLSDGHITLDGVKNLKGRHKVKPGNIIKLDSSVIEQQEILEKAHSLNSAAPENIPLNIVYQDDDIIVINKPDNLVVHPGAGNWTGTVVNALLYHFPDLKSLPRAGIIHRLDKDTTGLMVVARNLQAHNSLVKQLQERTVNRKYKALVRGLVIAGDTIDINIGRHQNNRIKMAVYEDDDESNKSKQAITHYRVAKKFEKMTVLDLQLETGRTHQIRVHLAHIGYPIVGDKLYGRVYAAPSYLTKEEQEQWLNFQRQALAAVELGFKHPRTGQDVNFKVDVPDDMQSLINLLDKY